MLKSFTLKFQQNNKCLWGNKRGRTKRRTIKELQELDPLGSPHLEERLIGGNVDLDILSLFPQICVRIMGGSERKASFSKVNNGGERGEKHAQETPSKGRRQPVLKGGEK